MRCFDAHAAVTAAISDVSLLDTHRVSWDLLQMLDGEIPGIGVEWAEYPGDSDVIALWNNLYLFVGAGAEFPVVSLDEEWPQFGDVTLGRWTVTDDAVLADIIATVRDIRMLPALDRHAAVSAVVSELQHARQGLRT